MMNQCPQLQQLPENVKKYWEEKQRELEDTLIQFSYTVFVIPSNLVFAEKTGILYLMERDLWFEDFPKPPLFFLNTASKYKKTLIQIPRQTITNVELLSQSTLHEIVQGKPQHSGIFQNIFRLIRSEPLYLLVSGVQDSGQAFQYAFRDLQNPESWVPALQVRKT